jgi:glycosyltransferase involved in cell wall biosynthesis
LRNTVAWFERTFLKSAAAVIIADETRIKQMRFGELSCSVIYNSPPDMYDDLKYRFGVNPSDSLKLDIFYAGILTRDRGLDVLIKAINSKNDFRLIVAGFGGEEMAFVNVFKKYSNVEFLGRVPYNDVLKLTYLSDCVIALYNPSSPNNVFASPNKLFESMMCGKPIIVSEGTAMASKVVRENCGLVVKYGSVSELEKALSRLKINRALSAELGKNGRVAYLRKYSWQLMEERLLALYDFVT